MFTNQENFSSATKAFFESQFASVNARSCKALHAGEKLSASNIAAAKALTAEFNDAAQQLLSKDPQTNADKTTSYGRHLRGIISSAQADFTQTAEAHITASNSKVAALVEDVTKNPPAASIHALAILKSVIGNANASYEQPRISTKQTLEQIASHTIKNTDQLSQAVDKTASNKA